jgi:hypothetical protein
MRSFNVSVTMIPVIPILVVSGIVFNQSVLMDSRSLWSSASSPRTPLEVASVVV